MQRKTTITQIYWEHLRIRVPKRVACVKKRSNSPEAIGNKDIPTMNFLRGLQEEVEAKEAGLEEDGASSSDDGTLYSVLLIILLVLLSMVVLSCCFHFVRSFWGHVRSSDDQPSETMLVHDGRIFNLTGPQRRAVLEAIFSGASKVRTSECLFSGIWDELCSHYS